MDVPGLPHLPVLPRSRRDDRMSAACLGCGRPIPAEHQDEDWHPGCWRKHTNAPRFTDSSWVAPSKASR